MNKRKKRVAICLKKGYFLFLIGSIFFQPLVGLAATPVTFTTNATTNTATDTTAADISTANRTMITPNSTNSESSSASNKGNMPTIEVVFDKTPTDGQQVTATAMLSGFDASSKKDLYYTWYIKHRGDGDNEHEKWKKEAAKIMAKGSFEANDLNSSGNIYTGNNVLGKGYVATPEWGKSSAENENCYMQSFTTGRLYEMVKPKYVYNCPIGYEAKCVKTKKFEESQYQGSYPPYPNETSCTFSNPKYCSADPVNDPNDTRACRQEPEYNVNSSVSACVAGPSGPDPKCETVDNENFTTKAVCPDGDGYGARCVSVRIFSDNSQQKDICSAFGADTKNIACDDAMPILYNSQVPPSPLSPIVEDTLPIKCVKYRGNNKCAHLFSDMQNGNLGDGHYDMGDEQYWGTNPNVKSTLGNNQVDEANLIGLNMNKFTWTYQNGDKIGVAVEGPTGSTTKHDDSSYVITWAFSKNVCKEFDDYLDNIPVKDRQFYTEQNNTLSSSSSSSFGIMTVEDFDINRCLKENLIDPVFGGEEQLKISLQYTPNNPKNIPGKNSGDTVDVNATVDNASGSTLGYSFDWKIEASSDGSNNPPVWSDVTDLFTLNDQKKGIGNDSFSFKLDAKETREIFKLNDKKAPIRVSVRVNESGGAGRFGIGKVIIPITNTDENIEAYRTSIESSGKVKIILSDNGLICSDANPDKPCADIVPVVRNEIVGMKFSDENGIEQIVWAKDGNELFCDSKITNDCSKDMRQVIPISEIEGSTIEITATVRRNDGRDPQKFVRQFIVVEPSVKITSTTSAAWEKITGYEKDLTGKMVAISSPDVFKTYFGKDVTLKASFTPSFIGEPVDNPVYVNYQWTLNGEVIGEKNNKPQLGLATSEEKGSIYSVSIDALYSQPIEKRKALQDFWGISAFNSQDTGMSHSIQIEAQKEEVPLDIQVSASKRFLASLIDNVSSQVLFMVRVLLSGGLFFIVVFVIFSVIPDLQPSEKRRF